METTTANAAVPTDERMAQHLRALVDEAEALLADATRAGGDKVDAARMRLQGEMVHLRQRLAELETRAGTQLRSTAHRTDEAVHAHPYSAMGTAAAIGLLVGLLIGRR